MSREGSCLSLDGLQVFVFRGSDGKLVVEIDSRGLADSDAYLNGSPKIRIWINEQKIEIAADGKLVFEE